MVAAAIHDYSPARSAYILPDILSDILSDILPDILPGVPPNRLLKFKDKFRNAYFIPYIQIYRFIGFQPSSIDKCSICRI